MQKPLIVKGTRDFSPLEMIKRNYIFDTIKNVYKLYGFQQIETPSMENLSTLMGKYGEEGDRLIFKILNSGDFLSSFADGELNDITSLKFAAKACEKGLRYDLTVPFARYVVMHRNDIVFPFKRFQIQPVWRADRPQKGRYREFYQCDADIIGSDSLLNEVELIQIIDEVFSRFNIRIAIKLNNRKILSGMAEYIGEKDKITDITVAIDKYEKIGLEQVNKELESKGLSKDAIDKLQPIILLEGTNREKLHSLKGLLSCSETKTNGIDELIYILDIIEQQPLKSDIDIDLTLARGLNYYTGAIIEVKALDVEIGSITGGGRYDDLTGVFGLDNMSGVGISFGADRIYDVLNQLDLYPTQMAEGTNVLISNMGNKELSYLMPIATKLRQKGISVEIYPDSVKLKKQLTYANSKHIKFVVIAGENEISNNLVSLKDMVSGEQKNITARELQDEIQLYFSR